MDNKTREFVLREAEQNAELIWNRAWEAGYNRAREEYANLLVDVAPVRWGEWLDLRGDYQTAKCSFCASQYEVTFGEESNGMLFDCFKRSYKYCPHCGAKMEVGNG